MKITVYRGSNQIGGCVTEYESNGWKLFVDYGEQLPGAPMSDKKLEIDGLTCGDIRKSALLISYHHGDYFSKIYELPEGLPIYVGKKTDETASEPANHLSEIREKHSKMAACLNTVNTFIHGDRISFGEFEITPLVIEHSAFDAYAFCIEAKELKVFHSGDFRKHGFRSEKLSTVIERYVDRADYVVYASALAKSVGNEYKHMNIGSHCDMEFLNKLFSLLKPKAIIPLHADNPRAVADLFCDKWPVILLNDGESFSTIRDPWFDTTEAIIYAYKRPLESDKVIDNTEELKYWAIDKRSLGEFQCWKDAEFALHHAVYAPNRLLAYSIETENDMAPSLYVVYNPDFTEHSEYSEGEHEPGGNNYQEKCVFSPGDKVLAIIENDVLMPCTFVGPVSEEFFKEKFRRRGAANEEVVEELVSDLWDWEWDSVVVKPLVKIDFGLGEMPSETTAQRIYVFSYKDL